MKKTRILLLADSCEVVNLVFGHFSRLKIFKGKDLALVRLKGAAELERHPYPGAILLVEDELLTEDVSRKIKDLFVLPVGPCLEEFKKDLEIMFES